MGESPVPLLLFDVETGRRITVSLRPAALTQVKRQLKGRRIGVEEIPEAQAEKKKTL